MAMKMTGGGMTSVRKLEKDVVLEILSDPQSYPFDTIRSAGQQAAALIEALKAAVELARAVLAQSITGGHNVPGPTPEDIEKAFWALDAALCALEGVE